jgi:hypothetical protein|tara:strand:- start:1575 stop:2090 length:516 start_codon:yes stop_codon:yes gene_type:complete
MKINEYKQMMSYLTRPEERPANSIQEKAFDERKRELKKDGDIVSDFDTQKELDKLAGDKTPESENQRVGEFLDNLEKKKTLRSLRIDSSKTSLPKVPKEILKNIELQDLILEIDKRLQVINNLNQTKAEQIKLPRDVLPEIQPGIGSVEQPNEITLDAIRDLKKGETKTKF